MVDELDPFLGLALAALVWFSLHKGVAGSPLRDRLVQKLGERGFRGAFALASLASLSWLIFNDLRSGDSPLFGSAAATSMLTIIGVVILLTPVLMRTWRDFKRRA